MLERYSILARMTVFFARAEAGRMGASKIDSEHLLLGLIRTDSMTIFEIAPGLDLGVVRERAASWQAPAPSIPTSVDMPLSDDGKRIFYRAESLAKDREDVLLRTEHLLLAMTLEPSHAAGILIEAGVSFHQAEQIVRDRLGAGQQEKGDWSSENLSELFG